MWTSVPDGNGRSLSHSRRTALRCHNGETCVERASANHFQGAGHEIQPVESQSTSMATNPTWMIPRDRTRRARPPHHSRRSSRVPMEPDSLTGTLTEPCWGAPASQRATRARGALRSDCSQRDRPRVFGRQTADAQRRREARVRTQTAGPCSASATGPSGGDACTPVRKLLQHRRTLTVTYLSTVTRERSHRGGLQRDNHIECINDGRCFLA